MKMDSFEALMLANIRTVKLLAFDGEDILALINHIELLCEKSMTRVYRPSALIDYDKSVRDRANKGGPEQYQLVQNVDVLRYFSYDSTVVAGSNPGVHQKKMVAGTLFKKASPCFAYNKSDKGCSMQNCKYRHACMYCRSSSHGAWSCSSGSKGGK